MTATGPDPLPGATDTDLAPGAGGRAPETRDWHALDADAALGTLGTGPGGLDEAEAARRLAAFGPNRLPQRRRRGWLARLLRQFHNLLIYVLLGAAALSAAIGHLTEALVILAVVVVNAAVGFIQEGRAEQALTAIRAMIHPRASVLCGGRRATIPAEEVVPGDIVLLEAGDRVPADLRLIEAEGLRADEAALTGESVPVDKGTEPAAAVTALGERSGMAYSGTLITAGQGRGVVVAAGEATELGQIGTLIGGVEELATPLLRQMDEFARRVTAAVLGASALVFAYAVLAGPYAFDEAIMVVVGLAVAAIPEGLPAVMTITLAVGVERMASRNAIIRRLPAVETLGAVSVICTDKTGTLTRNEMTARRVAVTGAEIAVDGAGYRPDGEFRADGEVVDARSSPILRELTLAGLLCNDAALRRSGGEWVADGDPMEGALVALALKAGHDAGATRNSHPRLDAIPFDARRRYMATLHAREGGPPVAYVKGAPERVLAICDAVTTPDGDSSIDARQWQRRTEALAADGQRAITLARREMPQDYRELTAEDIESDLVRLGLAGLIDPPREEAVNAVAECRAAGIRVKMITGDHVATARARHRAPARARPRSRGGHRPGARRARWGRLPRPRPRGHGLRPHQPGAQAAPGRGAAGRRADRRHDGGRGERRARPDSRRCRCGHGRQGNRGSQGGGRHGARRRQLRLDRLRRARRPHRLRQPNQDDRLHPADERRRRLHHHPRRALRPDPAGDAVADPLGQHGDGGGAGPDARLRADRTRRHAPPAARLASRCSRAGWPGGSSWSRC